MKKKEGKEIKRINQPSAVEASSPLVVLSHARTVAEVTIISAILTRFRSPPETPLTNGFPTIVLTVCSMLNIFSNRSII